MIVFEGAGNRWERSMSSKTYLALMVCSWRIVNPSHYMTHIHTISVRLVDRAITTAEKLSNQNKHPKINSI